VSLRLDEWSSLRNLVDVINKAYTTHGEDSKKSQLTFALFYKDEASKMDTTTIAANDRNEGLFQRRTFVRSW